MAHRSDTALTCSLTLIGFCNLLNYLLAVRRLHTPVVISSSFGAISGSSLHISCLERSRECFIWIGHAFSSLSLFLPPQLPVTGALLLISYLLDPCRHLSLRSLLNRQTLEHLNDEDVNKIYLKELLLR